MGPNIFPIREHKQGTTTKLLDVVNCIQLQVSLQPNSLNCSSLLSYKIDDKNLATAYETEEAISDP